MYEIINTNINVILNAVPENHVPMYGWLKEDLKTVAISLNHEVS